MAEDSIGNNSIECRFESAKSPSEIYVVSDFKTDIAISRVMESYVDCEDYKENLCVPLEVQQKVLMTSISGDIFYRGEIVDLNESRSVARCLNIDSGIIMSVSFDNIYDMPIELSVQRSPLRCVSLYGVKGVLDQGRFKGFMRKLKKKKLLLVPAPGLNCFHMICVDTNKDVLEYLVEHGACEALNSGVNTSRHPSQTPETSQPSGQAVEVENPCVTQPRQREVGRGDKPQTSVQQLPTAVVHAPASPAVPTPAVPAPASPAVLNAVPIPNPSSHSHVPSPIVAPSDIPYTVVPAPSPVVPSQIRQLQPQYQQNPRQPQPQYQRSPTQTQSLQPCPPRPMLSQTQQSNPAKRQTSRIAACINGPQSSNGANTTTIPRPANPVVPRSTRPRAPYMSPSPVMNQGSAVLAPRLPRYTHYTSSPQLRSPAPPLPRAYRHPPLPAPTPAQQQQSASTAQFQSRLGCRPRYSSTFALPGAGSDNNAESSMTPSQSQPPSVVNMPPSQTNQHACSNTQKDTIAVCQVSDNAVQKSSESYTPDSFYSNISPTFFHQTPPPDQRLTIADLGKDHITIPSTPYLVTISCVFSVSKIYICHCEHSVEFKNFLYELTCRHSSTLLSPAPIDGPLPNPASSSSLFQQPQFMVGELVVAGPFEDMRANTLYRFSVVSVTPPVDTPTFSSVTTPTYDLFSLDTGHVQRAVAHQLLVPMNGQEAKKPRFAVKVCLADNAQWLPGKDSGMPSLQSFFSLDCIYEMTVLSTTKQGRFKQVSLSKQAVTKDNKPCCGETSDILSQLIDLGLVGLPANTTANPTPNTSANPMDKTTPLTKLFNRVNGNTNLANGHTNLSPRLQSLPPTITIDLPATTSAASPSNKPPHFAPIPTITPLNISTHSPRNASPPYPAGHSPTSSTFSSMLPYTPSSTPTAVHYTRQPIFWFEDLKWAPVPKRPMRGRVTNISTKKSATIFIQIIEANNSYANLYRKLTDGLERVSSSFANNASSLNPPLVNQLVLALHQDQPQRGRVCKIRAGSVDDVVAPKVYGVEFIDSGVRKYVDRVLPITEELFRIKVATFPCLLQPQRQEDEGNASPRYSGGTSQPVLSIGDEGVFEFLNCDGALFHVRMVQSEGDQVKQQPASVVRKQRPDDVVWGGGGDCGVDIGVGGDGHSAFVAELVKEHSQVTNADTSSCDAHPSSHDDDDKDSDDKGGDKDIDMGGYKDSDKGGDKDSDKDVDNIQPSTASLDPMSMDSFYTENVPTDTPFSTLEDNGEYKRIFIKDMKSIGFSMDKFDTPYFCMKIIHIISDEDFAMCPSTSLKKYTELVMKLNQLYKKQTLEPYKPLLNEIVLFKENIRTLNSYYRGHVIEVDKHSDKYKIFNLDACDMHTVSSNDICKLPLSVKQYPLFLLHCCLGTESMYDASNIIGPWGAYDLCKSISLREAYKLPFVYPNMLNGNSKKPQDKYLVTLHSTKPILPEDFSYRDKVKHVEVQDPSTGQIQLTLAPELDNMLSAAMPDSFSKSIANSPSSSHVNTSLLLLVRVSYLHTMRYFTAISMSNGARQVSKRLTKLISVFPHDVGVISVDRPVIPRGHLVLSLREGDSAWRRAITVDTCDPHNRPSHYQVYRLDLGDVVYAVEVSPLKVNKHSELCSLPRLAMSCCLVDTKAHGNTLRDLRQKRLEDRVCFLRALPITSDQVKDKTKYSDNNRQSNASGDIVQVLDILNCNQGIPEESLLIERSPKPAQIPKGKDVHTDRRSPADIGKKPSSTGKPTCNGLTSNGVKESTCNGLTSNGVKEPTCDGLTSNGVKEPTCDGLTSNGVKEPTCNGLTSNGVKESTCNGLTSNGVKEPTCNGLTSNSLEESSEKESSSDNLDDQQRASEELHSSRQRIFSLTDLKPQEFPADKDAMYTLKQVTNINNNNSGDEGFSSPQNYSTPAFYLASVTSENDYCEFHMDLQQIVEESKPANKSTKQSKPTSTYKQGDLVVALFEDMWYRAVVQSCTSGGQDIDVRFIDFGNSLTLSNRVEFVQPFRADYLTIAPVLFKCRLLKRFYSQANTDLLIKRVDSQFKIRTHGIIDNHYIVDFIENGGSIFTSTTKTETIDGKKRIDAIEGKKMIKAIEGKKSMEAIEGKKRIEEIEEKKRTDAIEGKKRMEAIEGKKRIKEIEEKKRIDAIEGKKRIEEIEGKKRMEAIEGKKRMEAIEGKKRMEAIEGKKRIDEIEYKKKMQAIEDIKYMDAIEYIKKFEAIEDKKKMEAIESEQNLEFYDGNAGLPKQRWPCKNFTSFTITHVQSSSEIYLQVQSEADNFNDFHFLIQDFCKTKTYSPSIHFNKGDLLLAIYEGSWYRCVVREKISPASNPTSPASNPATTAANPAVDPTPPTQPSYRLFFVDFGNEEIVLQSDCSTKGNLMNLDKCFSEKPAMAFRCSTPAGEDNSNTTSNNELLKQKTGQSFKVDLVKNRNGIYIVNLMNN